MERRENIMDFCSALHSKMIQFRSTEKYCDVKIRVQDKSFPCHRVVLASASEYFDALFGGSFMEKDARETVLHDIDVETFQEILSCVYTGKNCKITTSNVFNLLSASLFLRIHPLEEACTEYIRNNVRSLQNRIQILALARSLNVTALINFITNHIIRNFESFYNDETLLEITFDDLSFLLDRWSQNELPFKYEDLLLHFLIRWVYHVPEERREYFIKLITAVDFERISPNNVTSMMQYSKDFIEQLGLERMPPLNLPPVIEESRSSSFIPVGKKYINTEDAKKRLCLKRKLFEYLAGKGKLSATCSEEISAPFHKDALGLHIYVEYISDECYDAHDLYELPRRSDSVKVLSSNEHNADWFVYHETDAWRSCKNRRTVVQESTNLLYCMEIFRDTFKSADLRQTFCTYTSTDLKLASSVLTSPPIHLIENLFNMCTTSNNDIYLFDFGGKSKNPDFWQVNLLSIEESIKGFYRYNCEVDEWFQAPEMKSYPTQNFPSICADNNLIYLIGGNNCLKHYDTFQGLDYRSGKWMTLPSCPVTYYDHFASNSCVLQDKVFVSNGPASMHSYDTVAGKWEYINGPKECAKGTDQFDTKGLKMLSYDNKLWLLHGDKRLYLLTTYSIDTYEWYHYENFNDVIIKGKPKRTNYDYVYESNIKDMITFKTC